MQTVALTEYLDVAQVVLYAFWAFFALLIFYIRQEDRREGYPLEHDTTGAMGAAGFPFMPDPKTYLLPHGGTQQLPNDTRDTRPINAVRMGNSPGAPMDPTGNPMLGAVGPGSYAERADRPDLTYLGENKIVPLSASHGYKIHDRDGNPIGMPVVGCDGAVAGAIREVWVDQSEHVVRYYEVAVGIGSSARVVLLPAGFANVRKKVGQVDVNAITASQFMNVPATKSQTSITLLEEDKIMGYFGGGMLYATPARAEPFI